LAEVSHARRDRAPLSRERIVDAALRLIDERGLDQLTMRRLGADLGVEAMSLYKHVAGKEAILDGVRELLLREFAATLAPDGGGPGWRAQLARFANAYRALGLAHPEAFGLLAQDRERTYLAGREVAEAGLERLIAGGLDHRWAVLAQRTVVRFVLGFGLIDHAAEQAPRVATDEELAAVRTEQPLVGELMLSLTTEEADQELCDFGLEAILEGLDQIIARG
jgi:AcrR family transcriptional regulator